MKLILFSHPGLKQKELHVLSALDDNMITAFHLRKSSCEAPALKRYLDQLPLPVLKKTVLHSHYYLASEFPVKGIHLTEANRAKYFNNALEIPDQSRLISTSYHSLFQLLSSALELEYSFLSPVFDSISKDNHMAAFNLDHLQKVLQKVDHDVIALGGIHGGKIQICRELGFSGVAVLGAVWQSSEPFEAIQSLQKAVFKL